MPQTDVNKHVNDMIYKYLLPNLLWNLRSKGNTKNKWILPPMQILKSILSKMYYLISKSYIDLATHVLHRTYKENYIVTLSYQIQQIRRQ